MKIPKIITARGIIAILQEKTATASVITDTSRAFVVLRMIYV